MFEFLRKRRKHRTMLYDSKFSYDIMMKNGSIDAIMAAKGWKSYAEMAKVLGFTRAYIHALATRKQAVSHAVIVRIALSIGNIHDKWWIFYEIVPRNMTMPDAFQKQNIEKYKKEIPYNKFSSSAEFRRLDGEIEQSENS